MYIKNRPASALYKLFIGIVALVGFWASLLSFGLSAWRLFSTYILLLAALYLLCSALIIAISKNRNPGRIPCPMLEGAIIVSMTLLCVAMIVCRLQNITIPSANGWHASLIYFVLPFLMLSDWILFARKGRWRLIEPFYWLAPVVIYTSLILLTADCLPQDSGFRYPVPFLDYSSQGVVGMLEWFMTIGVLMLIYGYILVVIDFAMSGKISHHVVLPHFKVVAEDEDEDTQETELKVAEDVEQVEIKPKPAPKPKAQEVKAKVQPKPRPQKTPKTPKTQHVNVVRNTDGFKVNKPKKTEEKVKSDKSTAAKTGAKPTEVNQNEAKPKPNEPKVEQAGSKPNQSTTKQSEPVKVHKIRKF